MTNTATNKVMDTGIAPVTSWTDPVSKKVINYVVAGNQDMSSGSVYATPTHHAAGMVENARASVTGKMTRHYEALTRLSPAVKPGLNSALGLQTRAMQHEQKLTTRAFPNRYAALKAQPTVAPKAAPAPVMPKNIVVPVGQIAAKTPEQTNRPELRVVSSNPTAPKKPQSLQQRMNYWSAGLACNIG